MKPGLNDLRTRTFTVVWSRALQIYCLMKSCLANLLSYEVVPCKFTVVWRRALQIYCLTKSYLANLLSYEVVFCKYTVVWSRVVQIYCRMKSCLANFLSYEVVSCKFTCRCRSLKAQWPNFRYITDLHSIDGRKTRRIWINTGGY